MRLSIVAILIAFAASTARADATWQTHEAFGLDFSMIHAPRTDGEVDAGTMLHLDSTTSRSPSWLMFGFQLGLFASSADRVIAPILFNARIGEREGPFARLDWGWLATSAAGSDDNDFTWSRAYGASVGWKLGPWALAAGALRSDAYVGPAWMFTLGRDFIYLDSVVTRTVK